jgi:CBS domain-containing protein
MKVKDLMATDVKCCSEFSTLNTAAQLMWDNDIGCVPVVDKDGRVIGMLTDRDICMAAYTQGAPLTGALVTIAMSKQVFSCAPDNELAFAEKLMREKQVRRLPVIDAQGRLVGLISLSDISREGEREIEMKRPREVSDAEIAGVMASLCAPRHRVVAHAV